VSHRISYHRQHRLRGQAKVQAHRNYLKHRSQNKLRARKRYKKMRNNPAFKRRQQLYRNNPSRFRRLMASELGFTPIPFWSPAMGDGSVVGVDDDEVFYVLEGEPTSALVLGHQEFLNAAYFLEGSSIDLFFELLDNSLGVSLEVRAVSDALVRAMESDEVRPLSA
jgi:hypothetical protein